MGYSYVPLTAEDKAAAALLARRLQLSPVLVEILYRRGLTGEAELRTFLYPRLDSLPDPFSMAGMAEAVQVLVQARAEQRPVYIHGDYDVDGITATSLLQGFFAAAGIRSFWYIPRRTEEQYGLSEKSLAKLLRGVQPQEKSVLITVDCGISSMAEVRLAKERFGCASVIITDHHLPGPELPDATAIINPKLSGCGFPFPHLAGVGVAFLFVHALRRALVERHMLSREHMPNLKHCLDLVALGTIADVVPLVGLNRTLVRAGLEVLAARQRDGVAALAASARVMTAAITAEDVAFRLAPRINACGRLGRPELGVQLFLAQDAREARRLVHDMEALNTRRKELEQAIMPAIARACEEQVQKGRAALAIYNPDCHPGILGILASRMVDRFGLPVILFTDDHQADGAEQKGKILKGSGRSVMGVNLHETLTGCQEVIEQFGGHPMAAGLTVALAQLDEFSNLFHKNVLQQIARPAANQARDTPVDYQVETGSFFEDDFLQTMLLMEPCGEGNPEPLFLMPAGPLSQVRTVGNHEHLVFQIETCGRTVSGVGFNLARQYAEFPGNEAALIFKLKQRYVRGREHPQMQVIELLHESGQ